MLSLGFEYLILIVPAALFAITMHEFAHGYVSYKLGDPTAKIAGRLTLNPLSHLDPIGTLVLVIAGFGWAKPVPIDSSYYENEKKGVVLVSLAGPLINFIIAFISVFLLIAISLVFSIPEMAEMFFVILFTINIALGIFNLIPIPPLDGSKIVASIIPRKYYRSYMEIERYGFFILIFLLYFGFLGGFLGRAINFIVELFVNISSFILGIF